MNRSRRRLATAGLAWALAWAGAAAACGVCVEDKVAATYDHAVVVRATAEHRVVVFASVDGPVNMARAAAAVRVAAGRARGVDAASVRTADNPAAISFALDPHAQAPASALGAVQKAAALPGLKLTLLRVVD